MQAKQIQKREESAWSDYPKKRLEHNPDNI